MKVFLQNPLPALRFRGTFQVQGGRTPSNTNQQEFIMITRFFQDESGATAIEYGLIAALVAVVIIAALIALGTALSSTFKSVNDQLSTAS